MSIDWQMIAVAIGSRVILVSSGLLSLVKHDENNCIHLFGISRLLEGGV